MCWGRIENDPGIRKTYDAVGKPLGVIQLVQRNNGGNAVFATDILQECEHPFRGCRVQAGDRLPN